MRIKATKPRIAMIPIYQSARVAYSTVDEPEVNFKTEHCGGNIVLVSPSGNEDKPCRRKGMPQTVKDTTIPVIPPE